MTKIRMSFCIELKKIIYAILFVLLISISAYVTYGALDTLEYAEAIQEVIYGPKILFFLLIVAFFLLFLFLDFVKRILCFADCHAKYVVPVLFGVLFFFADFVCFDCTYVFSK